MANLKKFIWDEKKPAVLYRPGTADEAIIQSVLVDQGEYLFPRIDSRFDPKICYDIGGNIGVVAVVLASIYPKSKIFSFEPVPENFELLKQNAAPYPNITALNFGLGGDTGQRRIWDSDDPRNLGGFSVVIKNPEGKNQMVSVRDVASVFQQYGAPDLIKIDVEGAEAEIFEAMPNIERVKWIAGELHGIRDFQVLDLLSKHFTIQCARDFQAKCWHFHALNRSIAESHGGAQNS